MATSTPFQKLVRAALDGPPARTQEDLAASIGVDQSRIARWLDGTSRPGPEKLLRVAQVLDVTVADLLDRLDKSPVKKSPKKKQPRATA